MNRKRTIKYNAGDEHFSYPYILNDMNSKSITIRYELC